MQSFFDYLYYKACKLYAKEDGAALSGVVVVAVLQMFNLLAFFFLMDIILKRKLPLNKIMVLLILAILVILNGIRYNKITYAILDEKWKNEIESKKIKHQLLVLLYVSVSVISGVGLAIYLGSLNR
jgi:hypothetical protein